MNGLDALVAFDEFELSVGTCSKKKQQSIDDQSKGVVHVTSASSWTCSFEEKANRRTWCGITQSSNDDFNWTMTNEETPSADTGPSRAYSAPYYVFIEASDSLKAAKAEYVPLTRCWCLAAVCMKHQ